MKNHCRIILKCLLLVVAAWFITACEKEHLQPEVPQGASEQPLVYMSAILYSDSIYYAGGVDSYIGVVSMTDTMSLRYFGFYLYNELSTPLQPRPSCKISINNARFSLGIPEEDLDSTIFEGTLYYQDNQSGFMPNAVTVEWYDSTGTMFSTALVPQAPVDAFIITSVEDIVFENKSYKKVAVEFQCTLMSNNFNTIPLTNGRATLLFGTN